MRMQPGQSIKELILIRVEPLCRHPLKGSFVNTLLFAGYSVEKRLESRSVRRNRSQIEKLQLVTQKTFIKRTVRKEDKSDLSLPFRGTRGSYFLKKNCNTKNNTILTTISNT